MSIAKVFKSGNSQAVRLPREFRFASAQVEIFRRGDEVVLRELGGRRKLSELLAGVPAAGFPEDIPDAPPDAVEWPE